MCCAVLSCYWKDPYRKSMVPGNAHILGFSRRRSFFNGGDNGALENERWGQLRDRTNGDLWCFVLYLYFCVIVISRQGAPAVSCLTLNCAHFMCGCYGRAHHITFKDPPYYFTAVGAVTQFVWFPLSFSSGNYYKFPWREHKPEFRGWGVMCILLLCSKIEIVSGRPRPEHPRGGILICLLYWMVVCSVP